jgi:ankyrin repeat protein
VEKGAAVNANNKVKQSPLHMAAYGCHLPCVQLLVEKGATVEAKDKVKQARMGS